MDLLFRSPLFKLKYVIQNNSRNTLSQLLNAVIQYQIPTARTLSYPVTNETAHVSIIATMRDSTFNQTPFENPGYVIPGINNEYMQVN